MRPESEAEVARIIRAATTPLSIVGGGTRLRPGEGRGARLTTAALTGITLYEPAALTLVARAGTPLAEIEAVLSAEGQRLAFEPPPAPGSTIGGVIAANASGPRRVKDGAARDSLLGVRFVDGSGEIIRNGGRVMKNVTGYDLVKLMAGSRGRLGVLTEVSLKTQPIPPASTVLSLPALTAAQAIPALTAALTGPWDVTAAMWLPGQGALFRIEGLESSVALRAQTLTARMSAFGEVARHDRLLPCPAIPGPRAAPRSGDATWRIVCRPSQAADILATVKPLAVDWGGNLILAAAAGTPQLPPGAQATRLDGDVPAGVPPMPDAVRRLNDGIRVRFDPRGILAGTD